MRAFIYLFLFMGAQYSCAQKVKLNSPSYFDTSKEYHYNAIYIDQYGDTITNELLVIKPLGHPWIFQPWYQTTIKYIYNTDTFDYKNYVDPNPNMHERNKKQYAKKGKSILSAKEKTGAYYDESTLFYLHPPRRNQYRTLFHAPHPKIFLKYLTDSTTSYIDTINFIGGVYKHKNSITPISKIDINNQKVQAWNLFVNSIGYLKDENSTRLTFDSTLDAIYTKEFGFIKLRYNFKNGIKIQFDLIEIVRE